MEIFITIIVLLIAHFLADFVFQTENMKKNKSGSIAVLFLHAFIYTIAFFNIFFLYTLMISYFSLTTITLQHWFQMVVGISIVNGIIHYIIDYFTSQLNKWLWNTKKLNLFFISIGFDQLLHTGLIIISFGQMLQNMSYI